MVADHGGFIAQRGEVVSAVPFFQERYVFQQQQLLGGVEAQPQHLQALL